MDPANATVNLIVLAVLLVATAVTIINPPAEDPPGQVPTPVTGPPPTDWSVFPYYQDPYGEKPVPRPRYVWPSDVQEQQCQK